MAATSNTYGILIMIERFIEAGERFSVMLSVERGIQFDAERLLKSQRDRCGIRNELDAMAKETCAEVVRLGGDPATVTRATVAAWNYIGRWHDVWFETRSHLTALLLRSPDTTRHDTKDDTPKKSKKIRPMNTRAADCARLYRADTLQTALKTIVEDYVEKHGGSVASITRVLNDNPDQWKRDTDTTI